MIESFIASLFNYFDDIRPAKNDATAEARMVSAAYLHAKNRFGREELAVAIHKLVHGNHYMVSEGPAVT